MILLSFDLEEFDLPQEYHMNIDFETQLRVSQQGTVKILDLLKRHQIKATFFSTVIFAKNSPLLIQQIVADGHEIASHTYFHSQFAHEHYLSSKQELENITQQKIVGFRMPRMQSVNYEELKKVGYIYDSSINPTLIPGRYNHFTSPRVPYIKNGIIEIPSSVLPYCRFPLFWLTFRNLPLSIYKKCCSWTLHHDKYLNLYFHPWEFTPLKHKYNFPSYITKNDNDHMFKRVDMLIAYLKKKSTFNTFKAFVETQKNIL